MSRIKRRMDREAYMREAEEVRKKAEEAEVKKAVSSAEELLEKKDLAESVKEAMANAVKEDTLPGIPHVEDEHDWSLELQKEFNQKFAKQISGNSDLIGVLQKEVDNHEARIKKLESLATSGFTSKDSRTTPSKVKYMDKEDYTGKALIPQAHDPGLGVTWPIRDRRVAEFYDANYTAAPCEIKKGLIKRKLTLEEASKAGC